jgi:hypothetical protein
MRTARSTRESPPQAAKTPSPVRSGAPRRVPVAESPFRAAADQAAARAEAAHERLAWIAEQRLRLAERVAALPPLPPVPPVAAGTTELRSVPSRAPSGHRDVDDRESLSA